MNNKRLLFLCLSVAGVLLFAYAVHAGDYHTGTTLVCGQCHTMHYSISHDLHGEIMGPLGPGGPFQYLLKDQVNNLCLTCHDGTTMWPDVLEANTGSDVRQAGGLNRASSVSPYEPWKGHTLEATTPAPGGTWTPGGEGLKCTDCHTPHGEIATQYRNLWNTQEPGDKFYEKSVTYAVTTNDLSKDVFERSRATFGTGCMLCHDVHGGGYYNVSNIDFNEPDETKSAMGDWCKSCHTNMHGSGGAPNMGGWSGGDNGSHPWLRHPTCDVNIGQNSAENSSLVQFQSHTNRVKVMSHSGNWGSGADVSSTCISCHKGHGNQNAFGLIYMSGTGTLTEQGDTGGTQARDLCGQCHIQTS